MLNLPCEESCAKPCHQKPVYIAFGDMLAAVKDNLQKSK